MAVRLRQHRARVSESIFYPFTTSQRLGARMVLIIMAAVTCGYAIALEEHAVYSLAVFFVLCDVPIEVGYCIVRKQKLTVYLNGEDCVGTVAKKHTYPLGPQFAVTLRYSTRDTVIESSRQIPFDAWLALRVGDSMQIRVHPKQPQNWVLRWPEIGSDDGSSGMGGIKQDRSN